MGTISTGFITDKVNGITINTSLPCNSGNYTNSASRNVKYVVIHYTGNAKDTAAANAKYFQTSGRNASAHFFVDDSNIYQSVEMRDSAWHCGCASGYKNATRNTNSIGIEMCTSGNYTVSQKTQINAAYLCANICKKAGIADVDTYVVRHYDVVASNKKCPAQFVSDPAQWTQFKTWVKNILKSGNHAGSTSTTQPSTAAPAIIYRAYAGGKWTSEVKDNAVCGADGTAFTAFMVKISDGSTIKYRAHLKGGAWLPYVTGYNGADSSNGYAGDGRTQIDAIEIHCDKYDVRYNVSTTSGSGWCGEVKDSVTSGSESYAGIFGKPIDKMIIKIV